MFDKEYSFKGITAERVNLLTSDFDGKGNKLFPSNISVYQLAPLVGFLYNKKFDEERNTEIKPTKIFVGEQLRVQDDLKFNYRLIMLLDKNNEPDTEKRIDKAFREYGSEQAKADEELFESYVRGGVNVLYEKLMDGVNNQDEYIPRLYDFMEEYDERYKQNVDLQNILTLCRKAKV